jgi:hypothetical protein
MKGYTISLSCDIYKYIEDGYTTPATPPTDTTTNNLCNENARAADAIRGGLSNPIFVKVMHCKLEK